jgi:acetyl esterase/lipase
VRILLLLSVPLAALLLTSYPTPVARAESAHFHRDVVYGRAGSRDLTMNVAHPPKRAPLHPVVLVFHGGGWIAGRKERHDATVRYLARQGFVAATVGYRLAPRAPWPAQIEDAREAVRYMRAQARRYGGDPKRIAAIGFSAGAHLSLLLGTVDPREPADRTTKVDLVVSYFAPTNLEVPPKDSLLHGPSEALGALLGPAFQRDRKGASPIHHVNEGDAPMLLFQGTRDALVPYEQTQAMLDKIAKERVTAEVVFLAGAGHGWREPHFTDTFETTLRFLDRHFRPERRPQLFREVFGR